MLFRRRVNCGGFFCSNFNIRPNSTSNKIESGFRPFSVVRYSTNNNPINANGAAYREHNTAKGISRPSLNSFKDNVTPAEDQEAKEMVVELEKLRDKLRRARTINNGFINAIKVLKDVKQKNFGRFLNTQDFNNAFWACSMVKNDTNEIAYWLYEVISTPTPQTAKPPIPADIFEKMMEICRHNGNVPKSLKIHEDFKSRDYPMTATVLSNLIVTLAENSNDDITLQTLEEAYKEYKLLSKEMKGWKSNEEVFGALALKYCRLGEGHNAVDVLRDLFEYHKEPSEALCTQVMDAALMGGNSEVIRAMAVWLGHFDASLKHGVLTKILELAASKGDPELGSIALKTAKEAGHSPCSSDYFCVIRAHLVKNHDYISAIEVLQAMEQTNVVDASDAELQETAISSELQETAISRVGVQFNTRQYESIKNMIISSLTANGSADNLDQLYFAMVDQVRNGHVVPRIALDAIVESSGRLDITDRAFATFQEYKGLFNIQPDIHSYNSLLASCAYARNINMHTLLSVFQDLDIDAANGLNCKPNSTSFTLLIEAMVDSNDFRVFDAVFAHMMDSGVSPSPRSMRRAIVAFLKRGHGKGPGAGKGETNQDDIDKAHMLKETLMKQQFDNPLPKWFLDRISQIEAPES
jgi:pentatricopeptide repeat protein